MGMEAFTMSINFALLSKNLDVDDIEWLPTEIIHKNYEDGGLKAWANLVAYKDARVDYNRLDEVCTPSNWTNKYQRDSKGILQCGIGIKCGEEWVWKWSNGVPSAFHKEKGEYSDAFKRAGVLWGIGRELYDIPPLFVPLKDGEFTYENGEAKTTDKFKPNKWQWKVSWDHIDTNGKCTGLIWAKQKTYTGKMEFRVHNTPIFKVWK